MATIDRRYRIALGLDETRQALRQAVIQLSWLIDSDEGLLQSDDWRVASDDWQMIRLYVAGRVGQLLKATRITITLVGDGDGTRLEIAAKFRGFGPVVRRELGARINQLANAIVHSAGVPLEPT
ncbi:MAG: hypothetical protein ABSG95_04860 [Solirubrobacteraceae bacterium]